MTLAALLWHLGRDGAHAMKDGCDGAAEHQARHRGPTWACGIAHARRCRKTDDIAVDCATIEDALLSCTIIADTEVFMRQKCIDDGVKRVF